MQKSSCLKTRQLSLMRTGLSVAYPFPSRKWSPRPPSCRQVGAGSCLTRPVPVSLCELTPQSSPLCLGLGAAHLLSRSNFLMVLGCLMTCVASSPGHFAFFHPNTCLLQPLSLAGERPSAHVSPTLRWFSLLQPPCSHVPLSSSSNSMHEGPTFPRMTSIPASMRPTPSTHST